MGEANADLSLADDVVAHRIASEFVRREREGKIPMGRDSLYNAVREAATDVLDALPQCICKPYHVWWCPRAGEDHRTPSSH